MSRSIPSDRSDDLAAPPLGWPARVRRAFARVAAGAAHVDSARSARVELIEAVTHYARELAAQRVPPERMLVEVKTLARAATPDLPAEARDALLSEMVPWCIEAFYAPHDAGGARLQAPNAYGGGRGATAGGP